MYDVYCSAYRARRVELTYENLGMDAGVVAAAVTPSTRVLMVVNPNQPIESCFTLAELRDLAARCRDVGALLLVDEAYYHFCDVTAQPLVPEFDNVVIVRTLSKAFGLAGLRIGYLMASPGLIQNLTVLKPIYEIGNLNAAIATYLLRRPHIMQQYVASVRAGRDELRRFAEGMGWACHGFHSNAMLVELPASMDAVQTAQALAEQGWFVQPETRPPTANHLRVTMGTREQARGLSAALSRLAAPAS
jgi:histidinol-phosphate aminotransferase